MHLRVWVVCIARHLTGSLCNRYLRALNLDLFFMILLSPYYTVRVSHSLLRTNVSSFQRQAGEEAQQLSEDKTLDLL